MGVGRSDGLYHRGAGRVACDTVRPREMYLAGSKAGIDERLGIVNSSTIFDEEEDHVYAPFRVDDAH